MAFDKIAIIFVVVIIVVMFVGMIDCIVAVDVFTIVNVVIVSPIEINICCDCIFFSDV